MKMSITPSPLTADETLEREFSPLRSRLLDVAAALDRFDRANGNTSETNLSIDRLKQIEQAIQILLVSGNADRAERIQNLFSREYDASWHATWLKSNQEQIATQAPSTGCQSMDGKKEDA